MLKFIERSWHRVAAATALVGAAVLASLVTVPPDLAKTAWQTEWIARVGIGLGSFFIAIAVIGTIHWVIVKGVPPSQVGLQPFSVGYAGSDGADVRDRLQRLESVDQRLGRELANVANLLSFVVSRLGTLERRTYVLEEALRAGGASGDA
ncbi:MAG TPA: hypothetical protein VF101_09790 [Gaiellaceae bacterium]